MKKGRFYKTDNGFKNYFKLSLENSKEINIPCSWPGYSGCNFEGCECERSGRVEISDFTNSLCFELLRTFGFEYNKETNTLEEVIYTWDVNLIPGDKFFGIIIHHLEGTENNWIDTFPNIEMSLDILNSYRFDLEGYKGIHRSYPLYLLYTEENIEIYKNFLEFNISKRFQNSNNRMKMKI